jgi:signal transduction histidine kinase
VRGRERIHAFRTPEERLADIMAGSLPVSGSGSLPVPEPSEAPTSSPAQPLWRDPLLLSAFLAVGLLLSYQLAVTLLQPAWIRTVTDWLQVGVAWSGLLVVGLVSRWFTRAGLPIARSWWWVSVGLLCYALASTVWRAQYQALFPNHVPIPSWNDLVFALQYPCFLLALLLAPRGRPSVQYAFVILDTCLLLGAAFALSWSFLLAPIYQSSQQSLAAKLVLLMYPVGDLALFFGLTVIWLHFREYVKEQQATLALLLVGSVCLFVGDTWFALLLLHTSSYRAGSPPDLFWLAFYLLLPLSGLVRFRIAHRARAGASVWPVSHQPDILPQDLMAGLQVAFPVAGALLASTVLLMQAARGTSAFHPLGPLLIGLGLLGLALARQVLTAVDNERLHRAREAALRQAAAQMETFLGIAGHELKNPLASMRLGLQVVEGRMRRLLRHERVKGTDVAPLLEPLLEPVVQVERQEARLDRLVDDLVDVARVKAGRLDFHLAPADLATVVRESVEEQCRVHPERTILLACPGERQVLVVADAQRLEQVMTNYLTNALKYSSAERSVAVGLQVDGQQAQVCVHDEGPGLPPEDQEHIWDRFNRAPGIAVQSGSGVELGLGLYISRCIIEQHHGQVGVQSAPGQGSTFWFSLPLDTPESAHSTSASEH